MSSAVVTDGAVRRTIGDILLAHGFVSEEALAEATALQERSAEPLGQILVQAGAITRLELASALAEQWSDPSASITPLPRSQPAAPTRPQPNDDAGYAARLQDAVADLARRVHSNEPLERVEERVTELAQQIESTLARAQRIETTVAALAESFEGVTDGVEGAFTALQAGTAELAQDLARMNTTLADLTGTGDVLGRRVDAVHVRLEALENESTLDQLGVKVAALAARPQGDPDGAERMSRIEAALGEVEARPSLDDAAADRIAALEAVLADQPTHETISLLEDRLLAMDDLRAAVTELGLRSAGDPGLHSRLANIELALTERVATTTGDDLAAVVAFGERLDTAEIERQGLTEEIREAHERLEGQIAALAEGSVQNEPALEELRQTIQVLRQEFADNATPSIPDSVLSERCDALAARIDELTAQVPADADLPERLADLDQRVCSEQAAVKGLAEIIEAVRGEIVRLSSDPREDTAAREQLSALSAQIEALAAAQGPDEVLTDRVAAVESRFESDRSTATDAQVGLDELRAEIAGLAAALTTGSSNADELEALKRRVEEVAAFGRDADEIEVIKARLDDLGHSVAATSTIVPGAAVQDVHPDFVARLDELARKIEERPVPTAPLSGESLDPPSGFEKEIDRLMMAIERIGLHLGEHDRALAEVLRSRNVTQRLDELDARIDDLRAGGAPAGGSPGGTGEGAPGETRALARRVAEAEAEAHADRQKLMLQLERMASKIDWRLQRLEEGEAE